MGKRTAYLGHTNSPRLLHFEQKITKRTKAFRFSAFVFVSFVIFCSNLKPTEPDQQSLVLVQIPSTCLDPVVLRGWFDNPPV
jgi:hypothetical protein